MSDDRYHAQIVAAREVGLQLGAAQERAFLQLLEEALEELDALVQKGLAGPGVVRTRAEVLRLLEQLQEELARSAAAGMRLTVRRVADLHARATLGLLEDGGRPELGDHVRHAFGGLGARAAAAVLARPELSRAIAGVREDAVATADRVLRRGVLRGSSAEEISRALRLSIRGAEAFPPEALRDLRRIGHGTLDAMGLAPTAENLAHVRETAGAVARRARLIARTEIMAAEHEAGIQAAIDSPVVAAIHWFLSNRHAHRCECDVLAEQDLFGLGPGHYDPRHVPARPHPRCLCGRRHVLRPVHEWGSPRAEAPALRVDLRDVAKEYGFPPSKTTSLLRAVSAPKRVAAAAAVRVPAGAPPLPVGRLPLDVELPRAGGVREARLSHEQYEKILRSRARQPEMIPLLLERMQSVLENPSHVGQLTKDPARRELYRLTPGDPVGVVVGVKILEGETWITTAFPMRESELKKHMRHGRLKVRRV